MKEFVKSWGGMLMFFVAMVAIVSTWTFGGKRNVDFGSYNKMYVTCQEREFGINFKARLEIDGVDSILIVTNLDDEFNFIFDLTNKNPYESNTINGYRLSTDMGGFIAVNHSEKTFMFKDATGCVFSFYNRKKEPIEYEEKPKMYKRIQRATF